jgi:hypothetical protein
MSSVPRETSLSKEIGKVKVLYIAGCGRSGSTILSNVLGKTKNFFAGGEIRSIWDRNLAGDVPCGCGAPFRECEVWKAVLEEAFGGPDRVDTCEMIRRRDRARSRHLLRLLLPGGDQWLISGLGEYRAVLENLYRAIHTVTGCSVIIDSSKLPSYAYVLRTLPTIDLYVVHLIRDPHGTAYSWQQKKAYIKLRSPLETSLTWNTWNVVTELFWHSLPHRYLMLRYEDFIAKPQESIERILDLVQEEAQSHCLVDEHIVELEASHTASGNPSRFQTGKVALRLDERWKSRMAFRDRALVTALTWPLLIRYGYARR